MSFSGQPVKGVIELGVRVLEHNDATALGLRCIFARKMVKVANLISSPGTGKTELVIGLGAYLNAAGRRMGVIVGDCATDRDARRISGQCSMVRQIITEGLCHLEAAMISEVTVDWPLDELDLLLIENVGNLVCPSDFDLGEDVKVALLSVAEGEDKPLKYPHLFSTADVVVITKVDLVEPCGTDMAALKSNVYEMNPSAVVVETSARTGKGVDLLAGVLLSWGNC